MTLLDIFGTVYVLNTCSNGNNVVFVECDTVDMFTLLEGVYL